MSVNELFSELDRENENDAAMNCTFLVVDDQRLMISIIKRALKSAGYKTIIAKSGKEALKVIKKYHVGFIISDWHMPNMTGIELLSIVRNDPDNCDIPFLMLTAETSEGPIKYAIEEGVDDYIIKPFSGSQLIDRITKIQNNKISAPDSITKKIRKIKKLMLNEKFNEAVAIAEETLKNDEDLKVLLILSECYFLQGNYENARKQIQTILETNPNNGKALHLLGKIFIAEKKYEEGIEYLKQSSEENPLNFPRRIEVGDAYLKIGLKNEAAEIFESLENQNITDLDLAKIGASYLSTGDIKNAGEYLDKTVDPIPETISVFNSYAIELRKMGEFEEALEQYKKCIEIEPESHILRYNLGRAYFEANNFEAAQKELETSIKKEPTFENAEKLLLHIKKISGRK